MKEIIQKNGKYWKECDIVILPTKGRKLNFKCDCKDEEFHHYHCGLVYDRNNLFLNGDLINLYLLSNEQINEGDWFYSIDSNNIFIEKQKIGKHINQRCKKIIASTDKSLKYNIEYINGGKMGEYSIPNVSEDFIKKNVESNGSIKKILVEYEGVESIIEQRINTIHTFEYKIKLNPDNTINILIEDSVEEAAEKFALENSNSGEKYAFLAGAQWQKNQLNN